MRSRILRRARRPPAPSPPLDYGLATLWPALLDHPLDPALARAGNALGKLTRLALEARAITTPQATAPLPLLLGSAWTDAGESDTFRMALAYAGKPAPDRMPLLRLFGNGRLGAAIEALGGELARDAEEGLDDTLGAHLRFFSGQTQAGLARSLRGARLFGFASPPSADVELARATSLARDALLRDPALRGAWEIEAWGDWCEKPRIAPAFPRGLVPARARALRHLRLVPRGRDAARCPPRRWLSILPGLDGNPARHRRFLGLVLRLVASLPPGVFDRRSLERPLSLLARAIDADGAVPVWLERDLRSPCRSDRPALARPAVRRRRGAGAARLIRRRAWRCRKARSTGRSLRSRARGQAEETPAVFHYVPSFSRLLLAKLSDAASRTRGDDAPRAHLPRDHPPNRGRAPRSGRAGRRLAEPSRDRLPPLGAPARRAPLRSFGRAHVPRVTPRAGRDVACRARLIVAQERTRRRPRTARARSRRPFVSTLCSTSPRVAQRHPPRLARDITRRRVKSEIARSKASIQAIRSSVNAPKPSMPSARASSAARW